MSDIKIGYEGEIIPPKPIYKPPKPSLVIELPKLEIIKDTPTLVIKIPESTKPVYNPPIDIGFGHDDKLYIECPKPVFHSHLCKENYLGEFETESEKQLARDNLGVYSKLEVNNALVDILKNIDSNTFITKDEVKNMISDLDFVTSIIKSNTSYDIPNNLFIL